MDGCDIVSAELAKKLDQMFDVIIRSSGNGSVTFEVKNGKVRFADISISVPA
jgi:uncharacterized protein YrrD